MHHVQTTPVTEHLDRLHIPYRVFTHQKPVKSLEEAAEDRGQRPEQIVRSLLFRLPGEQFVMVLVSGPEQIPWKWLRRYLNESRLTTADPAELLTVTGYERGAVSPFGVSQPLRILINKQIVEEEEISIGSGVRGTTVIMRSADLVRGLPDAELVDFTDSGRQAGAF